MVTAPHPGGEAGSGPGTLHVEVRHPLEDGPAGGFRAVLVHGSMDRSSSFGRLSRRLGDFTVVSYDRRGYGASKSAPVSADLARHVEDLLEVIGEEPCIAVGHSYGGDVVLAAAATRAASIETAVVFEPPTPWLPWWPPRTDGEAAIASAGSPADKAEAFMRRVLGDQRWERLPASTRCLRREEGRALEADMASLRQPTIPFSPAAVNIPVIAGYGTRSWPYHQEATTRLAGLLPRGELYAVEGSDHGCHLTKPEGLARLVRLALARSGRAGAGR